MSAFSGPYNRGSVTGGLILFYDVNEPVCFSTGRTDVQDLSRMSALGTLSGAVYDSGNGGSISFDGSNDTITTINLSAYSNLTIECWLYDNRTSGERDLLTYNGNSGAYTFANLTSFRTDGNALGASTFNSVSIPSASWYRLCYIKNTSVFFNETKFTTHSGTDNPYGNMVIGASRSDINTFFSGKIAIFKIYNRALSDLEVHQNFNAHRERFGI
jgi:hypothetical protein